MMIALMKRIVMLLVMNINRYGKSPPSRCEKYPSAPAGRDNCLRSKFLKANGSIIFLLNRDGQQQIAEWHAHISCTQKKVDSERPLELSTEMEARDLGARGCLLLQKTDL